MPFSFRPRPSITNNININNNNSSISSVQTEEPLHVHDDIVDVVQREDWYPVRACCAVTVLDYWKSIYMCIYIARTHDCIDIIQLGSISRSLAIARHCRYSYCHARIRV